MINGMVSSRTRRVKDPIKRVWILRFALFADRQAQTSLTSQNDNIIVIPAKAGIHYTNIDSWSSQEWTSKQILTFIKRYYDKIYKKNSQILYFARTEKDCIMNVSCRDWDYDLILWIYVVFSWF